MSEALLCSKVSAAKINHPVFVRAGLRDQTGQRKRKEEARKPINLLALDSWLTKCLTAPGRLHYLHSYLMPMKKANIKRAGVREKNLELSSVVFCYVELPSKTLSQPSVRGGSNFRFHLPRPGASSGLTERVSKSKHTRALSHTSWKSFAGATHSGTQTHQHISSGIWPDRFESSGNSCALGPQTLWKSHPDCRLFQYRVLLSQEVESMGNLRESWILVFFLSDWIIVVEEGKNECQLLSSAWDKNQNVHLGGFSYENALEHMLCTLGSNHFPFQNNFLLTMMTWASSRKCATLFICSGLCSLWGTLVVIYYSTR